MLQEHAAAVPRSAVSNREPTQRATVHEHATAGELSINDGGVHYVWIEGVHAANSDVLAHEADVLEVRAGADNHMIPILRRIDPRLNRGVVTRHGDDARSCGCGDQ